MTIIPAGYAEATVEYQIAGSSRPAYTVFGLDDQAEPHSAQGLANLVRDMWEDEVMAVVCAEVTAIAARVLTGEGTQWETEFTKNGERNVDQAPPNVTYLIQKVTGIAGRGHTGRMYIPGVPEGEITAGGFLDGTWRNTVQATMSQALQVLADEVVGMAVLHQDVGAGAPDLVLQLQCESKVATQRRRLRS